MGKKKQPNKRQSKKTKQKQTNLRSKPDTAVLICDSYSVKCS